MRGHGFLLANYVPGDYLLHRAPLALKFLLVVACGLVSFVIVDWRISAAVLAALCALFLLSDASTALNGAEIIADGGLTTSFDFRTGSEGASV